MVKKSEVIALLRFLDKDTSLIEGMFPDEPTLNEFLEDYPIGGRLTLEQDGKLYPRYRIARYAFYERRKDAKTG